MENEMTFKRWIEYWGVLIVDKEFCVVFSDGGRYDDNYAHLSLDYKPDPYFPYVPCLIRTKDAYDIHCDEGYPPNLPLEEESTYSEEDYDRLKKKAKVLVDNFDNLVLAMKMK